MKKKRIALLTDFGVHDPYTGIMKGVIASINSDVPVIDLTHGVRPQDVLQGAFFLSRSYRFFPGGTIFAAVVDPGVGSNRRILAVEAGEYTFLAPDNGLLTMVLDDFKDVKIYEVTNRDYMLHPVSETFHGRDIFASAAGHLSKGLEIGELGTEVTEGMQGIIQLDVQLVSLEKNRVRGPVIFADHFGNLVTAIPRELLTVIAGEENSPGGGGETIAASRIRIGSREIARMNLTYSEAAPGELIALIGSYDTLEIAVNGGSARDLLGSEIISGVEVFLK